MDATRFAQASRQVFEKMEIHLLQQADLYFDLITAGVSTSIVFRKAQGVSKGVLQTAFAAVDCLEIKFDVVLYQILLKFLSTLIIVTQLLYNRIKKLW